MRLGTAELDKRYSSGGLERRVKEIKWHPKYKPGRVYFDVGIATAEKPIDFTEYVRPVCLPYLPTELKDSGDENGNFFTLGSLGNWEYERIWEYDTPELRPNLKISSVKVI